jgi:hypothetical protein
MLMPRLTNGYKTLIWVGVISKRHENLNQVGAFRKRYESLN